MPLEVCRAVWRACASHQREEVHPVRMMRISLIVTGGLGLLLAGIVYAQDAPSQKPTQDPQKRPQPMEWTPGEFREGETTEPPVEKTPEMKAWEEYAEPGDKHKLLESLVGEWEHVSKWRMDDKSPWAASRGRSKINWIMEKRFLQEDFESADGLGGKYNGRALLGHDNFEKTYTYIWLDNMGTGFLMSEGRADDSGKVFTLFGTYDDPATGQRDRHSKTVIRIKDKDQFVHEIYFYADDGREMQVGEIAYSRK